MSGIVPGSDAGHFQIRNFYQLSVLKQWYNDFVYDRKRQNDQTAQADKGLLKEGGFIAAGGQESGMTG